MTSADPTQPSAWHCLGPLQRIPEGLSQATVGQSRLCLVRQGPLIAALDDQCVHAGAPLSAGWLRGGQVVCPWHRFRYEWSTGRADYPPGSPAQPVHPVRVRDGLVFVLI